MTPRKLSELDFQKIEAELGIHLPIDFKQVYMNKNGGRPSKRYFIDTNGNDYIIHEMHKFLNQKDDETSIEKEYFFFTKERKLFPDSFVPFAEDDGGAQYCISIEDAGVWFWNPDDFQKRDPFAALTKIADSIDYFLANLVSFKEVQARSK